MTTTFSANRSCVSFVGAATLAVLAMGFTCQVQARDPVYISLGIAVPGLQAGVANGFPVYTQPPLVYAQPAPVYIQPPQILYGSQPVYVIQQPNYYGPHPVYLQPQPIYYGRHHGRRHQGGYYTRPDGPGYASGYAPGYVPGYYRR